jgi:hypothetical protein
MNFSSLLSVVIIASLLTGSPACACEPAPDESSADAHHQHHVTQDAPEAHCDHQDCNSCITQSSVCASLQVFSEHGDLVTRPVLFDKILEFEFPDQAPPLIDTGQPPVLTRSIAQWAQIVSYLLRTVETPIHRKDRLNE